MKKTVGIATMEAFDNRRKNTVGSSRIRARWLLNYWDEAEEYRIGEDYDVMIYQKVYWKTMQEKFDGIQIFDLCDPDWLERKPVLEYVDLCDATVTSSEALRDFIKQYRPQATVKWIRDRLYLPDHQTIKQSHSETLKKVVWFGYNHNVKYLERTFDVLAQHNLEITIISEQQYNAPYTYRSMNINFIPYSYEGLHKDLIGHDALIMPPATGDLRGKYKTNNKTTTGWALKLPVINEPKDIERLKTREAREKEAEEKYQLVLDEYDVQKSVREYKELIEILRAKRK